MPCLYGGDTTVARSNGGESMSIIGETAAGEKGRRARQHVHERMPKLETETETLAERTPREARGEGCEASIARDGAGRMERERGDER